MRALGSGLLTHLVKKYNAKKMRGLALVVTVDGSSHCHADAIWDIIRDILRRSLQPGTGSLGFLMKHEGR